MRESLVLLTVALALCGAVQAQPKVLREWRFDRPGDLEGWTAANHISGLRVADGSLQGTITDWDPFLRGPQFEIPATPWQRVEIRLKSDCGGGGEIFWTNTTESQYGGFSPGKETPFEIVGDNQWHEVQIYPFWQSEKKIILLRVDFARPPAGEGGKKSFAVDWIRIVDLGTPTTVTEKPVWDFAGSLQGWEAADGATIGVTPAGMQLTNGTSPQAGVLSGALRCPLEDLGWVAITMKVDRGASGTVKWVSSEHPHMQRVRFPLRADGQFHTYNVDMATHPEWSGEALLLSVVPSEEAGATATIKSIAITEQPQGGPDVECSYVGLEEAINRAGPRIPLLLKLVNQGGAVARDLRIAELTLPAGVTVAQAGEWRAIPPLEPFEPLICRVLLAADRPVHGTVQVKLSGAGAPARETSAELLILESLGLARADYVPAPRPVESDYELGALYFPGWPTRSRWDPIERTAPIRKPVLGWYDEGNPECVDWQIKWAAENGIKFFMVDWYWSAGNRSLEHWVKAYQSARYRKYLKWCMMWANHNAPNTHSEADQRAVTQYWLDNYFNTPEYYRIDDMPVVMVWSVGNMDRDLAGKGGAKRLLEISQEMVRQAGYKGIYFVAMKWPEASTDPKIIQELKDKGFAMTSIYHYMHHGGKAANPQHFSFDLVAESSYPFWQDWHKAGSLPFLPNLATGWDSRPWHGDRSTVIDGRTVPLFRRICEDAKRFADETGVRRMVLAPLNEWGEGSYLEPCKEFGFEMYNTVRDVLCKRPAGGWAPNIAPSDVGLGPYDLPVVPTVVRTAWDFSDGAQGWGPAMGVAGFKVEDRELRFTTATTDPAVTVGLGGLAAKRFSQVIVRLKVSKVQGPGDSVQLFWITTSAPVNEAASVRLPLIGDGQFHDYVFKVAENGRWKGKLQSFRLDPGSAKDVQVAISQVRLVELAP